MSEPKDQAYNNRLDGQASELAAELAGKNTHYIYQYWVVDNEDPSIVISGPYNSRDERGYNPYWRVVKTKHKVLGLYED
ncbi:MAG: hypothetical protein ACK5VI_03665 [Opitutia bacterium]